MTVITSLSDSYHIVLTTKGRAKPIAHTLQIVEGVGLGRLTRTTQALLVRGWVNGDRGAPLGMNTSKCTAIFASGFCKGGG